MGILLVIFAAAIGYATFIENDYDATTARMIIYNARWFEILMLLMVINFSGMIFTKKLYRREQLNVLLIHLSLIIIIVGAGLTRYLGFEGIMHIRNGQISNTITSIDTYLSINADGETIQNKILLSTKNEDFYSESFKIGDNDIEVTINKYIDNAVEKLTRTTPGSPKGSPILNLIVEEEGGHAHSIYVKKGESKNLHELGISYGDTTTLNNVHIIDGTEGLEIRLPLNYKSRETNSDKPTHSKFIPLKTSARYRFTGITLILTEYVESGILEFLPIEEEGQQGTKVMRVSVNDKETTLLFNEPKQLRIGDIYVNIRIGSSSIELPFALHLKEFQLERYPGSNSPSSFASEIVLLDKEENLNMPYRIFMNNILSYKGYRFYQSSYDQDEKGTVFSVNNDYWGTFVTYLGYFLLFGTLIVNFFTRKTRFARLLNQFEKVREKRKSLTATLVLFMLLFGGIHQSFGQDMESLPVVSKEHAESFGKLQLQSNQGRVMPINTMASEFLVKIYKKDTYNNLTADQVFLEMVTDPVSWITKPMVKIGDEELKKILGISDNYARYIDFFTQQGEYKISNQVNEAYMKRPALRTKFDKEVIYVDERVNVITMAVDGSILRIFPLPHHTNNTWGSATQFEEVAGMIGIDSLFTTYSSALLEARKTSDYDKANEALEDIKNYQKQSGKAIILSDRKVNLEILYNQTNIFKRLFPFYLMLGIFLSGLFFIQVFKPNVRLRKINLAMAGIVFLAFAIQTFGLILRWYISGHEPWSNGYESMIYISWVTVLAGIIFMKKSSMALAVTTLLAGITLLTAHMSWMNPEITNLVPVLKSYWLTIHVATITASYGFLGLGAMLGFMNMCIMIFRSKENKVRINLVLTELSIIIEMALIVGLVLLIIGNFLGGIWANESWGRYWGWDPKETWTLVTIIAYSFILHMKLIPGVRTKFSFNFASLIAFGTVLMTYFGVNFYLSGLHSYAKGDPVPIPSFVYYLLVTITLVSAFAAFNSYRLDPATNGKN